MRDLVGTTIAHYHVLEFAGQGGMGVVYKARDMKLERIVALKFLPSHLSASDEDKARFMQEAKAASSINHPNVCTIYSIDEHDGQLFIVMEYVEGHELRKKIAGTPLPVDEAVTLAKQIAEGLQAAHKKEIVHRDIKSANIMLTESGQVKIMDFGLAKTGVGVQLTKAGTTLGTVSYMSPEQARGDEVDCRTDIWSFGVVFFEMLTGRLPFKGDYEQAVLYSIVNEKPEIPDTLPAHLGGVLKKALAKNPVDRYQSAGEIANELRSAREGESRKRPATRSTLIWSVAGATAVLLAAVFVFFRPFSHKGEDKDQAKTIAVLPFVNMSADPDQEYFSDGLSEELINVLAQNPHLRVTARTSSFSFKGANVDIMTIAGKLNVQHVLEGSIRKSGNTLRITAQLIDVVTDSHLWSETYDETLDNIFAVQDTIAHAVARALKTVLLGKAADTGQRETNPEAYNAYLMGMHFSNLREKGGKAAGYYQQALSIDSGFAPAWVGLSRAHAEQANDGLIPVDEGYRKARREVEKALALDPNLAEAHAQMGWIKRRYDWDWKGADECYQRALKLDPGDASVVSGAAGVARTLGRFDEAIPLLRRAVDLDPVSPLWHENLGLYSLYAGLLDESQAAYGKCLELNPQATGVHSFLGIVLLLKGKPDSGLAEVMREPEADWRLQGLAIVNYALGRKKESDTALAELVKGYSQEDAYQIAEIYGYRGEVDKAFEWLERAYSLHDGGLASIKGDPLLRRIEKDPRYAVFMAKMKLPL